MPSLQKPSWSFRARKWQIFLCPEVCPWSYFERLGNHALSPKDLAITSMLCFLHSLCLGEPEISLRETEISRRQAKGTELSLSEKPWLERIVSEKPMPRGMPCLYLCVIDYGTECHDILEILCPGVCPLYIYICYFSCRMSPMPWGMPFDYLRIIVSINNF